MKRMIKITGFIITVSMLLSCVVHDHSQGRSVPPGHVKKVYVYEKKGHGHHRHHKYRKHGHHR
ncbi:hypothetical protein D1631_11475 [Chryseobacterium nematophagum]|uniref:Quinol oxidase subunit 4 n=1 Tax=Chryseobacterium nematophagum TaxID=2305228 RepID=A0A3M7TJY7_9FLAO|nr:hypothetical protein [Chryseobacterium nematophagum]RNA62510.1 hypothetical protein D1631_11475 [Chryseobacterium nematophagum]